MWFKLMKLKSGILRIGSSGERKRNKIRLAVWTRISAALYQNTI
ncbi:hypothetical protein D1AOALGA4SA_2576 [Olavius algarvensis Delta 1 endosymbiont]|nr:hypothetical protein D1AOALGA4SA_2576 [Olavius algarvensis Delta 1 endosymbiont]